MKELDKKTKKRIKTFKEEVNEWHDKYVEKYKHIKCKFHGCVLWYDCSKRCKGLYDDHIQDCESWVWGWHQAVSEYTGNVAPY